MADEKGAIDRALGMHQPIHRRDFVNGMAVSIVGIPASTQVADPWPQDQPGYYPPLLTGMRGSHPGSFEEAQPCATGLLDRTAGASDTGEHYDLVVVGGGISGLSAAHFYAPGAAGRARS